MISNEVVKLLGVWEDNLFLQFSVSEIMKFSGKKTKTWVFNSLKLLTKHKILVSERKGNLNLYSLNMDNTLLFQALQYLHFQKLLDFPELSLLNEIIDAVSVKNYCLIIFGSYAENKQRKNSDMDVCFLVEDNQVGKKIVPYLNEVKLNHLIRIDEHYITFSEFKEMLLRVEENLGKQIVKKHLIFFNSDIYYQLLKEAHSHGFK